MKWPSVQYPPPSEGTSQRPMRAYPYPGQPIENTGPYMSNRQELVFADPATSNALSRAALGSVVGVTGRAIWSSAVFDTSARLGYANNARIGIPIASGSDGVLDMIVRNIGAFTGVQNMRISFIEEINLGDGAQNKPVGVQTGFSNFSVDGMTAVTQPQDITAAILHGNESSSYSWKPYGYARYWRVTVIFDSRAAQLADAPVGLTVQGAIH